VASRDDEGLGSSPVGIPREANGSSRTGSGDRLLRQDEALGLSSSDMESPSPPIHGNFRSLDVVDVEVDVELSDDTVGDDLASDNAFGDNGSCWTSSARLPARSKISKRTSTMPS
jgi:hypothetical protein